MVSQANANSSVLIIIPAWNEESTVAATIAEVKSSQPAADILVVDDGSDDQTATVARSAGVLVCQLPFNLGVGGAMRAGYRFALRNGYDIAVQLDADGQHIPDYLDSLIKALDDADIVIGARFAGVGTYRIGILRRIAMRMLATALSRLARTPLSDVTSGFRVVNRRALAVFARHYPAEYLGDTVESLVIAIRSGCRITQVPVEMRERLGGTASQSNPRAILYLARAVAALGLALVRRWPATFPSLPKDQR
jgi:glycosyltransferase involved in cell wall biosynthesis